MIEFMGCRYVEGGRTFPEYDCYGIVLAVRAHLGMRPLPDYSEIRKGPGMHAAVDAELPNLIKCEPQHGAMAICWQANLAKHVGVVVEVDRQLRVLEINPGKNVTLSAIPTFERRYRRVEYFT